MRPIVLRYTLAVAELGRDVLAGDPAPSWAARIDRIATLKMSPPLADPPEDDGSDGRPDDQAEPNTYGLPDGQPIARRLRRWFGRQLKKLTGWLGQWGKKAGDRLPKSLPSLDKFTGPMADAMRPVLARYWRESGKATLEGLGLSDRAASWDVTDPHLAEKIEQAALAFCKSTNDTTTKTIEAARLALKAELRAGLVDRGETIPELTRRVQGVYERLTKEHAELIAITEASRAVHAAGYQSAIESGVVVGVEWLLGANACKLCHEIANKVKRVKLGQDFAVIGDHPDYRDIKYPPGHARCRCGIIYLLSHEYGGPEDPQWGTTLDQPRTPARPTTARPLPLPKPSTPAPSPALGLSFSASDRARRDKDRMVWIDVDKLNAAWKASDEPAGYYVAPPTDTNPASGKYRDVAAFLDRAKADGIPVQMSQVHVDEDGNVSFTDGRHRFAVLRDRGASAVPVTVARDGARRLAGLFGAAAG